MEMEPAELIRLSKCSNEQKYELLNLVRRDNVVEELINYILTREDVIACQKEAEISDLNDNITRLNNEISDKNEMIKRLEVTRENNKTKAESLVKFIETFKKQNNRYPSIDEAWNTAWNSCVDSK